MRGLALTSILAAGVLASCGGASPASLTSTSASASPSLVGLPDDTVVTYAFHDSSVPPPYHRSVTLTVDKASSHIVIDSYGDVLADETTPTPPQTWGTLGATVASVSDLLVEPGPEGCTGGTSIDLVVTSGATPLIDVSPQFCAGSNEGLDETIDSWIAPARDLFPSMDVLAPTH